VGDVYAPPCRAPTACASTSTPWWTGDAGVGRPGGKTLKDALALLSKIAGHRVLRVEDGVYRVVPLAGGEPLADRPVQEEPLPAAGVKP